MGACLSRGRRATRSQSSDDDDPFEIPELEAPDAVALARQHKPGSPSKPRSSSPQTRDALLRALQQLEPLARRSEPGCRALLPPLPEAASSVGTPSEGGDGRRPEKKEEQEKTTRVADSTNTFAGSTGCRDQP